MTNYFFTNYSRGYVVEIVEDGQAVCESWLLLPAENLWGVGVRGFLYILAMIYLFLGIAIASDIFMCSIEVITSQRRVVIRWDEEKQEKIEKEVLVWNETVANLTLMALGSSAPEILLSVIDTSTRLGMPSEDSLGTFTIIGSAAFNLLIITAICIASVPFPDTKRVKALGVFLVTSAWSIFAYLWMLIVLSWFTPGEITLWEAWLTLGFFPLLVLSAYCQDKNWWSSACRRSSSVDAMQSQTNVRVISDKRRPSMMQGLSKELGALEKEKQRNSMANLKMLEEGSIREPTPSEEGSLTKLVPSRPSSAASIANKNIARARFRHAAVRSLLGGKKRPITANQPHAKAHFSEVATILQKGMSPEDLVGKFTFAAPSYSVLESAGIISIDVLFHRVPPGSGATPIAQNGTANGTAKPTMAPVEGNNTETSFINGGVPDKQKGHKGIVAIEFETREGSGKIDKDFKYTQGKLVFTDEEYKKTISVPIINDNQYEADVDFYLLLKSPEGDSGIGDPNICRVTIIDDDEPGEFQFAEPHYYADINGGVVHLEVTRQKGCDGTVTLEYTTVDGTAKGGDKLDNSCDYERCEGNVTFLHNESSKVITIDVNKQTKEPKNFIITLKNPSLGAKIGEHGATVAYINKDVLDERIADILDDDDEILTWGGQFRNAMTLSDDDPENPLKWYDYLLHFLSFFWKILLAFIPPKHYAGSWPCFICSLLAIGGMTAVVEQLGTLLGCVLNIKASVAGITIIALGTSVPDTFASRTAALHDSGADAAIGNITGSNSVNVFLGLGLPWVMSAMYAWFNNSKFEVNTDALVQSVVVFTICGSICIVMLLLRRRFAGGELGGAKMPKYLTSLFLVALWALYIIISSLTAYFPNMFPW